MQKRKHRKREALLCYGNQTRGFSANTGVDNTLLMMPVDIGVIATHVNVITRLLIMTVDAHHVDQIGRNIAAHNIVIARLLLIIRIRLTPIRALKQREYFDERSKRVRWYKCARRQKSLTNTKPYLVPKTKAGFPH